MTIIRDMLFGFHHFSDFLKNNPGLSAKVLADRLKELEGHGFIQRREIVQTGKREVEYHLTSRGIRLKQVLFALSMFGATEFPEEVFGQEVPYGDMVNIFGNGFKLEPEEIEMMQSPQIEEAYSTGD